MPLIQRRHILLQGEINKTDDGLNAVRGNFNNKMNSEKMRIYIVCASQTSIKLGNIIKKHQFQNEKYALPLKCKSILATSILNKILISKDDRLNLKYSKWPCCHQPVHSKNVSERGNWKY